MSLRPAWATYILCFIAPERKGVMEGKWWRVLSIVVIIYVCGILEVYLLPPPRPHILLTFCPQVLTRSLAMWREFSGETS
jgi:hypothetical protein